LYYNKKKESQPFIKMQLSNSPVLVNWLHILVVAPFLLYIAYNPQMAYLLKYVAVIVALYHGYLVYKKSGLVQ
jgi:hypothetical protein